MNEKRVNNKKKKKKHEISRWPSVARKIKHPTTKKNCRKEVKKGKAKQQNKKKGKQNFAISLLLLLFWLFVNFQLD